MNNTDGFRQDIQGLRGLAILSVLVYHADHPIFPGGYVGVDIFFVISGYLITGIVTRGLDGARFSLPLFYRRRVLRLFPALFTVVAATAIAGCLILPPQRLVLLGQSMIAAAVFASNIYFYRNVSYFAVAAEWHPLLHTWTLAVEEQFYLLFPLLLVLLHKRWRRGVPAVLWLGFLLSLVIATTLWFFELTSGYFLPFTRAYELVAGGLLVAGRIPQLRSRLACESVAAVGLAALVASILLFDSAMIFPGFAAMLPVAGCALVIAAGERRSTYVGRLVSLRPLTFVGDVSYSLYLWHWPILVYARYLALGPLSSGAMVGCLLLSLALAWPTYLWIERPLLRSPWRMRHVAALGLGGSGSLCAVGARFILTAGWPARFTPQELTLFAATAASEPERGRCHFQFDRRVEYASRCVFGANGVAPSVALWSDSFGAELSRELGANLAGRGRAVLQVSASGCPPSLRYRAQDRPACAAYNRRMCASLLADPRITTVVLAANYLDYNDAPRLLRGLDTSIALLRRAGKRVIVLFPVPHPPFSAPEGLGLSAYLGRDPRAFGSPRQDFEKSSAEMNEGLAQIIRKRAAEPLTPADVLCDRVRCHVLGGHAQALYFDDIHLSLDGAKLVADRLTQMLAR